MALECVAQATKEAAAALTARRAVGVLPGAVGTGDSIVACSTSSDVPYAIRLHSLLAGGLALKLLIEGEEETLIGLVDVACAATAAGEAGGGLGDGDNGGGALCGLALADLGGFEGVACTTTAGVGVFAWVWVWLGDLVVSGHFDGELLVM